MANLPESPLEKPGDGAQDLPLQFKENFKQPLTVTPDNVFETMQTMELFLKERYEFAKKCVWLPQNERMGVMQKKDKNPKNSSCTPWMGHPHHWKNAQDN